MDESYVSIFLKCYNCMKNPENAQVSEKNCNGQRNNKFNKTRKKKKKKFRENRPAGSGEEDF